LITVSLTAHLFIAITGTQHAIDSIAVIPKSSIHAKINAFAFW